MTRKGIVLAGGTGSRLHPSTKAVSKQLLPIYDKPLIYYSLSVLMMAGIKDLMIITTPHDKESYINLFKDFTSLGINLEFRAQENPEGIAQAFHICEDFIGTDKVALILGDNIFYGSNFTDILQRVNESEGATVFGYHVDDPERFGVVAFNDQGNVIDISEKPDNPKSNYAVTGLYFYDNDVVEISKSLKKSERGEYEITDLNKVYLDKNNLNVELLDRGFAWLDAGTHDSLLDAGNFIKTIESRQGLKIGCLEEISLNNGWITKDDILSSIQKFGNSSYASYLSKISK